MSLTPAGFPMPPAPRRSAVLLLRGSAEARARAPLSQMQQDRRASGGLTPTQEASGPCPGEAGTQAWLGAHPHGALMGPSAVGVSGPCDGGHGCLVGRLV